MMIGRYQASGSSRSPMSGMLSTSREALIIRSDPTLAAYIAELHDHRARRHWFGGVGLPHQGPVLPGRGPGEGPRRGGASDGATGARSTSGRASSAVRESLCLTRFGDLSIDLTFRRSIGLAEPVNLAHRHHRACLLRGLFKRPEECVIRLPIRALAGLHPRDAELGQPVRLHDEVQGRRRSASRKVASRIKRGRETSGSETGTMRLPRSPAISFRVREDPHHDTNGAMDCVRGARRDRARRGILHRVYDGDRGDAALGESVEDGDDLTQRPAEPGEFADDQAVSGL